MSEVRVKILNVVICDDIRRETTGKDIIIGAFGGSIQTPLLPAQLALSAWVQLSATGKGNLNFKVRWLSPQDVPLATVESKMQIERASVSAISFPQLPIQVQSNGKLKLQIQQGDEGWETISEIDVELTTPSISTAV